MGGAIGVLVETKNASEEVAHDVALQIAAAAPRYITSEEVPADEVNHEKEILLAQAMNDEKNANKPKEILEKMILGKIGKFYKEVCLLEQPFVKDQGVAVKSILNGGKVVRFTRLVMGEGLEKKEENLQDENLKAQIKTLFTGMQRSSGSEEFLEEMFINGDYEAVVTYESSIINMNKKLVFFIIACLSLTLDNRKSSTTFLAA